MNRSILLAALLLGALPFAAIGADPAKGQSDGQVARLVKELQAQQAAISDNQAKIDAKLAAINESIRQARIFSSRSK